MAKSVCLTTDMTDFILVDDNNTVEEFSLSGNGVDVQIVNGVLIAEASRNPNPGTTIVERSTVDNVWSFEHPNGDNELFFVGIIDYDTSRTPESHALDPVTNPVNIRLVGNNILISSN